MESDSTSTVMSILAPAEYSDVKVDNPNILNDLGQYITLYCNHGAKSPVSIQVDGKVTHLCCLRCVVDFILKDRVKARITVR